MVIKEHKATYSNNTDMVIKERKARLQEFLQNYKLGCYSVTRAFPSLQKGQQCQTRRKDESITTISHHTCSAQ